MELGFKGLRKSVNPKTVFWAREETQEGRE